MEHSKKVNFEYLSSKQPDVLHEIHRILREDGISEQSYARIFYLTFNQIASSEERVTFIAQSSSWQIGNKAMSDAKILVALSQVCELIHDHILNEWNNSLFAAWVDPSALERIEAAMDSMESLNKLKAIIQAAAKMMPSDGAFVPPSVPQAAPTVPPSAAPKQSKGAPMINWGQTTKKS